MLRRIARPLLASWFVYDGYDALRHPESHVEMAREPVTKIAAVAGQEVPSDTQIKRIVQAQGAATIFLGLSLAFSKTPRTAGLLLALSTTPHAIATAPVSKAELSRSERMRPFIAKVGAVGAALLVAADTAGKPSMRYRVAKARADRAEARSHEK
ncbi:DoxX family protein [Populibacterium corticicola]|uniref:DoxX family protein n=1 Tax=Populibacterium corticicola TaxID=1812826 RepID=A0ABW5XD52_9MICO